MKREQMIDAILKEVEDWDLDTLITQIQLEMLLKFDEFSDRAIEDHYKFLIGEERA